MEKAGNAEALKEEILKIAGRESAGIIAAAAAEAENIVSSAGAAASQRWSAELEAAKKKAARSREMTISSVPAEAARLRAARTEQLLDSIKAEALAGLAAAAEGAGRKKVLAALAAQAVLSMEGEKFMIAVAPGDLAAAEGLAAEIERLAGRGKLELEIEGLPGLSGGAVVRDADGRQHWDNSFKARLERLWPDLRGRILPEEAGGGGANGNR